MHNHVRRAALAGLATGALVLPLAAPAAADWTVSQPLAEGLAGPVGLSVSNNGVLYVGELFSGNLTKIDRAGERTTVVSAPAGPEGPSGGIAGVEATRLAQAAYVTSGGTEAGPFGELRGFNYRGETRLLADLAAWEQAEDPDADVRYGFLDLPPTCSLPGAEPPFAPEGYAGVVESNPYAVTSDPGGWVVADAGGNSLISVRRNGEVSTLAVLPRQELEIGAEEHAAINAAISEGNEGNEPGDPDMALLPACVEGSTFAFEPVPTDVEMGPDGMLYVTTLPGGPESPGLGARGKVYSVDRRTGEVAEVASGFFAATNLTVADDGTIYVAELFGGRISRVVDGEPELVVEVPTPGAVDWHRGALYASIDLFGEQGGSVVRITP